MFALLHYGWLQKWWDAMDELLRAHLVVDLRLIVLSGAHSFIVSHLLVLFFALAGRLTKILAESQFKRSEMC